MKLGVVVFLCSLGLLSCDTLQQKREKEMADSLAKLMPSKETFPILKFDNKNIDLGKIYEGDSISHIFHFTNKGNMPLIINEVNASCGCTATSFTKGLIMPNNKGSVRINFNSKNKIGVQNKTITVYANTPEPANMLSFKINVLINPKNNVK